MILLVVPLVSLVGLWSFAASVTLGPAVSKRTISQANDLIGLPGSTLSTQLQLERAQAVVYVGTGGRNGGALTAQRARTDAAEAAFRRSALGTRIEGDFARLVKRRLAELVAQLDRLDALRASVDRQTLTRLEVVDGYGAVISSAYELFDSLVVINDLGVYQSSRALTNVSWAVEFTQRQISLVGAASISRGRLSAEERSAFARWTGASRQYFDTGIGGMSGAMLDRLRQVTESPDFARYRQLEQAVLADAGSRLPARTTGGFNEVGPRVVQALGQAVLAAGAILIEQAEPIGERIVTRLVVAGGVGLLAVIASILLSFLFGRRLARELRDLQGAARMMAEERLPRLVTRLRRGERVDMDAEAPALAAGRTTEIGRVAEAFTQAQRVAVQSAVGESMLRRGINRVFLNLAWRSQSLLHRQLRMLDEMERRATDPEVLQDLFRLDHLTTRMRRHAEGLVILSGASPGRAWSRPARMEDVLRAAISEVEDYERVEVAINEEAALVGDAVADVVHMLAELIENAAAFSPPNTEIVVRGGTVGNGFAVEIIDRGIGIDAAERARLNDLLSRPPEFDLADTERLGLFVVSRLAARQGARVVLQESAYTGTTAVVVLPRGLVVGALAGPAPSAWNEVPQEAAPQPAAPAAAAQPAPWIAQSPAEAAGPRDMATPHAPRPVLPRREKLANLAPQLRETVSGPAESGPAPSAAGGRPPADPPDRPAEGARDLWDSLQDGWSRGRDDRGENA
ncbi:sensor histidine kinase [Actinomadura monticuli]|uniref:histidine kinase n=1 Tax=Actinomadura monticuli TaxID=3097367 RepID=A0ABV4QH20_9ACTN